MFLFLQIVSDFLLSIQIYFAVRECYKMVLSTVAFCRRSYLRISTFQGILGFSFYLIEVEVL